MRARGFATASLWVLVGLNTWWGAAKIVVFRHKYLAEMALAAADLNQAYASFHTVLISFDAASGAKTGTLYAPGAYVLQDIEVSPWKELFVADRTPTLPGIRIYDVFSNQQVTTTPIDVGLPPFDITFSVPIQTGIGDPPAAGSVVSLGEAYPNPFNPATTIPFTLASDTRVTLGIYDALGRRVRTLIDEERPAGPQAVTWDGRDDESRPVPSGIYFVELSASGTVISRKIAVLK